MKKIGLIHRGTAYAPGIWAYQTFFEKYGYSVKIIKKPTDEELKEVDVEWHLMGFDISQKNNCRLKIHEFVSLSIPPFPVLKNLIKKWTMAKPDLRVFTDDFIRGEFGFRDTLPYLFAGAGIRDYFFQKEKNEPQEFDFVYVGSTDETRDFNRFLNVFVQQLPYSRLLVVGVPPANISSHIQQHPSVYFTGKIPHHEVPNFLKKARIAINFMPDVYPFCHQRALKLMEYCAMGLPVMTTSYEWVNNFEQQRNARFFKLKPDLSNLKLDIIEAFDFVTPDVQDLRWEDIFLKSGILDFLKNHS